MKLFQILALLTSLSSPKLFSAVYSWEANEVPRVEAFLKASESFYSRLKSNSFDYDKTISADPLGSLPAKDLSYLKTSLKRYGLAPFTINGTQLHIRSRDFSNADQEITVDFGKYYEGLLIVQGVPYAFDPSLDLQSLDNKTFRPLWQKFINENKKTSYLPIEILSAVFSLQGCTPADKEKSKNTSKLVMAYARLCADCVGIITAPEGLLISGGATMLDYIAKSCRGDESCVSCRDNYCKRLPVVGPLKEIVELHRERAQLKHQSSSGK